MVKKSAGIVLYKFTDNLIRILLVHPGGPFWAKKDLGAWSIPKGEFTSDEDALEAAKREFKEETGTTVTGHFTPLQPVKQKGGKQVYAWALQGDIDVTQLKSNTFELEWPPRSGRKQVFPEVDTAAWFDVSTAKEKINPAQFNFIEQLEKLLSQ